MMPISTLLTLVVGFQAPGALPSRHRAVGTIATIASHRATIIIASAEPEAPAAALEEPSTIFTLKDRNDGWNDVRSSIKQGIKEREKPLKEIKENYVEPAQRAASTAAKWTSAAVEVVAQDVTLPDVSSIAGSVKPTGDIKQQAIGALSSIMDAASAASAPPPPPPPPPPPTKGLAPGLAASGNAMLFTAIPGLGLLLVGVLVPATLPGFELPF